MKCQKTLSAIAILGVSGLVVVAAPPKTETQTNKVQKTQERNATTNRAGENTTNTAGQRTEWRSDDHMIASCVAIDNQEEVAVARFAQKKLQSSQAKHFAQMLIDDHTDFLKKLKEFAPEATGDGFITEGRQNRENASRDNSSRENATEQAADRNNAIERETRKAGELNTKGKNANTATPNNNRNQQNQANTGAVQRTTAKPNLNNEQGGMQIDMLQLHREIAQQCLSDTEEMLNEKDGEHFDECFIGLQIAKHASMKSKLEVFERHASGELKDLLAKGLKTTKSHLKEAEDVIHKLTNSDDSSSKSSRKSNRNSSDDSDSK